MLTRNKKTGGGEEGFVKSILFRKYRLEWEFKWCGNAEFGELVSCPAAQSVILVTQIGRPPPQRGRATNCPSRQKTLARRPHNRVLLLPETDHTDDTDRKQTLCGLKDLSVSRFLQLLFSPLTFSLPADHHPHIPSPLSHDALSNCCNKKKTKKTNRHSHCSHQNRPLQIFVSEDVLFVCADCALLCCRAHWSWLTGSHGVSGYG